MVAIGSNSTTSLKNCIGASATPGAENAQERSAQFQDALNEFFVDEGVGWQMIGGELVTRGTETFEYNVRGAIVALEAAGRATAQDEIR